MNVEKRLIELAGRAGAKIHAGRSRNDQVALDLRLWTRDAIDSLLGQLSGLRKALVRRARGTSDVICPGYTHLQRAQPVLFAHVLLSFHEMIVRDEGRLIDCRKRVDVSPLGAGALAGTSLRIDLRRYTQYDTQVEIFPILRLYYRSSTLTGFHIPILGVAVNFGNTDNRLIATLRSDLRRGQHISGAVLFQGGNRQINIPIAEEHVGRYSTHVR